MNQLRFATIGSNFIAERFLEAAGRCEGFKLGLIYSRTRERAEEFQARCHASGCAVCTSLDEIGNSSDIDAVYVASPTCAHCEQTAKMLKKGKHVLCEKPAASNYHEWEQMLTAARENGTVLLEATRPVFHPGLAIIRENLAKIGPVRKVFLQYCQYSSRYNNYKKGIIENAFRPELSNGALMDLGIYCIETMVALFGKPVRVLGQSIILPGSIDGEGSILAEYPEMQALISYSKISDSALPCEIQGENGSILWQNVGCPSHIILRQKGCEDILLFDELQEPDMAYEIREFLRLVQSGERPDFYNEITTESLKITDEVRRQSHIVFPADNC